MQRHLPLALILVAAMALPAAAATQTQTTPTKHRPAKRSNDFGFLPGYRPPEVADREDRLLYWRRHPTYWYGWPGFYRGQWNGGGFGPCWTQTPIGNVWNCGK
jgi:hypothetical protein